ncbi:MAG: RES family NAD+ phosphorylase [Pseudomonadota bacterium]
MIDAASIPVETFTEPTTCRLLSTAHIDEPAISPLADDPADLDFLHGIEGLTSGRRVAAVPLPSGVSPQDLVTESHGYGWTHVNAAFCYTRATGNRFSGPDRGAWYAAYGGDAVETAQAEVSWHLTRELEATGVYENLTAYRELLAGFTAPFHDLHGFAGEAFLDPDPAEGYRAGQTLAATLLSRGSNGVLYPSVRRPGGCCLAAFRPSLVQNIRQGTIWAFEWDGQPEPHIRPLTRTAKRR